MIWRLESEDRQLQRKSFDALHIISLTDILLGWEYIIQPVNRLCKLFVKDQRYSQCNYQVCILLFLGKKEKNR